MKAALAPVCTSMWYCPPETLVATQRDYSARGIHYSFLQVCPTEQERRKREGGWERVRAAGGGCVEWV